jgi:glycosyltransferase involved in cell wall biosynthesis
LVIVGEGPQMGATQEEVRRRSLEASVRFLGLRSDVGRLLAAADLFLLTSVSEGIPLTLIEAMAAGLPVVATDVGGVAEVVENGRTGLLANRGDYRALAEAVLHLADNPALRLEMGKLGHARASTVFCESHMHAEYDALYTQMLRSGSGRRSKSIAPGLRR